MHADLAAADPPALTRTLLAVFPTPAVSSEVRLGPTPVSVPRHLRDVAIKVFDDHGHDYRLGASFLADGQHGLAAEFLRWRATWMRTAVLDRASSLLELADLFDRGATARRWALAWAAGVPVAVTDPVDLIAQLDRARLAVHHRCAPSYGFVDASRPGARGLMGAWSSAGGRELISAGPAIRVECDAASGLCVSSAGPSRATLVEGVRSVRLGPECVEIDGPDGTHRLSPADAAPLAWLNPGCTHWCVRPVPEVIVWAKTFARLGSMCSLALDRGQDVQLWFGVDLAGSA